MEDVAISFQFRFNWKITVFSAFFCVLFVNLGFWQLRRAAYKVHLLELQAEKRAEHPRPLSRVPTDPKKANLMPVRLAGHYDVSQTFLLDNRVLNQQVGFEVLEPFKDDSIGKYVLVDRGFVPMGKTRNVVPSIPPLQPHSISALGSVYVADTDNQKHPQSDTTTLAPGVTIVEVASPRLIGKLMGRPFYPHVVRLSEADANALPRYWPVTMMMPSQHRGYAVQWFLMALAIVIMWCAFSFKREKSAEES